MLLGEALAQAKRAELNSLRLLCSWHLLDLFLLYIASRDRRVRVSLYRRAGAAMPMGMKGLLVLTLGLAMAATSSAVTYKVGDSSGWTILGNINYTDWTAKKDFHVGDIIEFTYPQGIHNVLEVTKAAYDSCSNSTPIATHTSGDDKIAIRRPGHRFFICGVPGHCAAGQKVNIRVLKPRSSDAPSKAPAPARSSSGGSEPSAASPPAASSTDSTPDAPATSAPAPNANGAGAVRAGYRAAAAMALAAVASMAMLL